MFAKLNIKYLRYFSVELAQMTSSCRYVFFPSSNYRFILAIIQFNQLNRIVCVEC